MEILKTEVSWSLNDYCKSECSYCPIQFRGGPPPKEKHEYLRVANSIVDAYNGIGRQISWIINGGEPLDLDDIAPLLRACKGEINKVELNTNGGRLWVDWWAIEPYVDRVNLTCHYWQNLSLIKYIVDTFRNKSKPIYVTFPIRPNHFDHDINKATELEDLCDILVTKTLLYKEADANAGMFSYNNEQLEMIGLLNRPRGMRNPEPTPVKSELVIEKAYFESTTWDDRYKDRIKANPSFTGQLCNAGVEYLFIGAQGWATGSNCGNQSLGNIWQDGWRPPVAPQQCTMISCVSKFDQKITKFPLTAP